MKKLPYGISNYEELITENYYYGDKTKYIEVLENLNEKRILLLRPRKFGKSLFTSTLEYYYDINSSDKFDTLFGNTYIGKNPTKMKSNYYILRFDFSGIDTKTEKSTINGFRENVIDGIETCCDKYNIDFSIEPSISTEGMLSAFFRSFRKKYPDKKIYVIIDEYDHFANELLGFNLNLFKNLVSKDGKVRKWYEVLKKGAFTVVDRIFITGVTPITLDSLTSGFNIATDITRDDYFNEMMGFTYEEINLIIDDQGILKKEELFPIMKENYDGYKFSGRAKVHVYKSNMCLYFLNNYMKYNEVPQNLIDVNISSDYSKLAGMLNLCNGEMREKLLQTVIAGDTVEVELVEKFNPVIDFEEKEFVSLLFYLGYLTIENYELGLTKLKIPNQVMGNIYSEYFLSILNDELNIKYDDSLVRKELALEGKIDESLNILHTYLSNLSNRDYEKFDEKYVKVIYYSIIKSLKVFSVKSEMEASRNYPDIFISPYDTKKDYYNIIIEFKYLKKKDASKLDEMKEQAKDQIMKYSNLDDIKRIKKLKKYTVVAIVDELYVDEID